MSEVLKTLLAGLTGAGLFCPSVSAQTYKVGMLEWMPYATAYVAEEKGFWKAEGLDVQMVQYKGAEQVDAFNNGKIDILTDLTSSTIEMVNDKTGPIVIFEHDISNGGDRFILDNAIKDINEIKGKSIGVYTDTVAVQYFLHRILSDRSDLTMKDIELREVRNLPSLTKAFERKAFAGIVSYDPEAWEVLNSKAGREFANSSDFPGVIGDALVIHQDFLKGKPEDVRKFMRGWLKAIKWHADPQNRKEYYAILNRTMFKEAPLSDQEFDEYKEGFIIADTLESIKARNQEALPKLVTDVLDYLETKGTKVRTREDSEFINTQIALEEAEAIFK